MQDPQRSSPPPNQGAYWHMDVDQLNEQPFSEDEASEAWGLEEEEDKADIEEEDGEDLYENMMDDYRANPEIDWYERAGIDDED